MEVKPGYSCPKGYKQTEVGVIPEEWKVAALETVARIIDPQPDHRTPPEMAGGEPYIGISDFIDDGTVNWDSSRKIVSRAVDKQQLSFQVGPGNIIFGKIGTIGSPRFLPTVPFRFGLSANVLLIQPRIEPNFVMSWLRSKPCQRAVTGELHSTSQAAFGINKMRRVMIPLPPETEQRAIATALSDVDGLLGGLDQLIAKKRDLKQAAMQQLLTGQTRLPGFHGEWEVKRLGSIADVLKGSALSKSLMTTSGTRRCILYGELFTTYGRVISGVFGRTNSSEGCPSIQGDVLMPGSTTTTGIDLATASALLMDDVALGGDIIIIRRKGNAYDSVFLANYLTQARRHKIAELTQGITIHHLYGKDLKTLVLELPSLPEQTAIAEALTEMDAELVGLEQRREKTRTLKQAMMQELLTGRTRLI